MFTPSAEEAVKEYEPISRFETPAEMLWLPKALFAAAESDEAASVKAEPCAPEVLPIWLEIKPCKLFEPCKIAPVTVAKFAVDCTSTRSERTRVVFAGTV